MKSYQASLGFDGKPALVFLFTESLKASHKYHSNVFYSEDECHPVILMLRLYAMYSQSKWLVAIMVPAFVLVLITELVILVISSLHQVGIADADPHAHISMQLCILQNTWHLSYLYWLPFLVFETMLFVLALAKGVRSYRDHELRLHFAEGKAMRAMEVLVRDSILVFCL